MCYEIDADYFKAGDPSTSQTELERIAITSTNPAVRRRLAENPMSPLDILLQLAADEDDDVRIELACNPATPDWLTAALSRDDSATVRFAIADDVHTPIDVLQTLQDDENPYVAHAARNTIDSIELELALQESGFKAVAGDCYKLGAMLVMAGLLEEPEVYNLLTQSVIQEVPLGQAIARARALPKRTITKALMLQTRLRKDEISQVTMINSLRTERLFSATSKDPTVAGKIDLGRLAQFEVA